MEAIVPLQVQEAAGFVQNAMTGEEAARIRQQHVQPDFSIRRCNFSNTSLCFDKHGNEKAGLWKTIQVRFSADRNYLVQLLPRTDRNGFFEMPGPTAGFDFAMKTEHLWSTILASSIVVVRFHNFTKQHKQQSKRTETMHGGPHYWLVELKWRWEVQRLLAQLLPQR